MTGPVEGSQPGGVLGLTADEDGERVPMMDWRRTATALVMSLAATGVLAMSPADPHVVDECQPDAVNPHAREYDICAIHFSGEWQLSSDPESPYDLVAVAVEIVLAGDVDNRSRTTQWFTTWRVDGCRQVLGVLDDLNGLAPQADLWTYCPESKTEHIDVTSGLEVSGDRLTIRLEADQLTGAAKTFLAPEKTWTAPRGSSRLLVQASPVTATIDSYYDETPEGRDYVLDADRPAA